MNKLDIKQKLNYISLIEEDWDGEGANATNFLSIKKAYRFSLLYLPLLENVGNICNWYFDITRSGDISILFENNNKQLYIIFSKNDKEKSWSYAFDKELESNSYRICVNSTYKVDDFLLNWIKLNLIVF